MRKRLFGLLALSLLTIVTVLGQKPKGYNITVKIAGIKDTVCYLAYHYGDKQYLKDTAKVNSKGVMVFDGKEELPGGIYMVVLPSKNYFEFIMKDPVFSIETDSLDLVGKMKFKGSIENDLFYQYLNFVSAKGREVESVKQKGFAEAKTKEDSAKVREQISTLDKEVIDYREKYITEHPQTFLAKVFKAMKDPEVPASVDSTQKFVWYKQHYFDQIDFTDDRIVRSPIYHNKIKTYFETLTLQIPDSVKKAAEFMIEKTRPSKELFKYTTFYCTYTIETSNIMCMDEAFVFLSDKYYKTKQAFWLNEEQNNRILKKADKLRGILCGKTAPNLIMPDTAGRTQVLHNVKADYTVLIFWDPGCGHCKKAVPKLKETMDSIPNTKAQVFSVVLENKDAEWKKFIREHKLNFINVWDPTNQTNFRKLYDINSTPVIFVLDKKKEIIGKQIGVEQVKDFIEKHEEVQKEKEKKEKQK